MYKSEKDIWWAFKEEKKKKKKKKERGKDEEEKKEVEYLFCLSDDGRQDWRVQVMSVLPYREKDKYLVRKEKRYNMTVEILLREIF